MYLKFRWLTSYGNYMIVQEVFHRTKGNKLVSGLTTELLFSKLWEKVMFKSIFTLNSWER